MKEKNSFKFRAWDTHEEVMNRVDYIDFVNGVIGMSNENVRDYEQPIHRVNIMQYTGCRDKNGIEIFEGDILHWKDCEPVDDEMVYEDIIVVYWSDEFMMWKAKNEDTDYIDLYDYSDNRELEVLGNIYENPELLDEVEE